MIHFTCRLDDGTVFDSSSGGEPLKFTIGNGEVLSGLEESVIGMIQGSSLNIKIPIEKAFGPYRKDMVKTVRREQLPSDIQPEIGMEFQLRTSDGENNAFRIIDMSESFVLLDANHPLAGKDLLFEINLIKILPASTVNSNQYFDLGNYYSQRGQFGKAVEYYRKALLITPHSDIVNNNLATALKDQGLLDEAMVYYEKALQINPDYVPAYGNLGNALRDRGRLDDAEACYRKALQINPDYSPAYGNLGNVLRDEGRLDDAEACYRKAIELSPTFVEAYYNLGTLLREQNRIEEAASVYDRVIEFSPDNIRALWERCLSELPIIYQDEQSLRDARNRYSSRLQELHSVVSGLAPDVLAAVGIAGLEQPFYLPYQGFNDCELQKIYGEIICKIMASRYPQFVTPPEMPTLSPGETLRVGFVSGFFCIHSNWKIPIKGWMENIDRRKFSLYAYYTGNIKDTATQIARRSFDRFVEDVYSFEELCRIIRNDNLHILIYPEIGMHPVTGRLAALRLAPVQCTSWGHPNTSGFPTIDYFISSDLMEPPDAERHYTEKLVRLPNLSIFYSPLEVPHSEVKRDTFNLHRDSILYLCCQSLKKYLPQYDFIFPEIARRVGNCQFLFIAHSSSFVTKHFLLRISRAFSRFDLDVSEYVTILPKLDAGKYHAVNHLADIYLDSMDWSGGNTTLEALACNLPVITLPGNLMRGRHSMAVLQMMKVEDTIAEDIDGYIEIAAKLGQDPELRNRISEKIGENKHLVYEDRTCIFAFEDFLERAVKERPDRGI